MDRPNNFKSSKLEKYNSLNKSAKVLSHARSLIASLRPTPEQQWHNCEDPRRGVDLPQPFDVSAARWQHTSV